MPPSAGPSGMFRSFSRISDGVEVPVPSRPGLPNSRRALAAERPPQQAEQHDAVCTMKPIRVHAEAIHMKASMRAPRSAWMLRSTPFLTKTLRKMENMTVAMTEATTVRTAMTKVKSRRGKARSRTKVPRRCGRRVDDGEVLGSSLASGYAAAAAAAACGGREETASGERKMATKQRTVAERKRPNIQCEAVRAMRRASEISAGRATAELAYVCRFVDKREETGGGGAYWWRPPAAR